MSAKLDYWSECIAIAADECGTGGEWEFTAWDNERPALSEREKQL